VYLNQKVLARLLKSIMDMAILTMPAHTSAGNSEILSR